jgi:ribosomal protein S18 acetylase RimI-like enzyme
MTRCIRFPIRGEASHGVEEAAVNIRPATKDDAEFLQKMLYEAATWNPDWPHETIEEVLAEPMLKRFYEGWGRPGDSGVIAELDGVPVAAAWYRLFTKDAPGYGFVDEKIPEIGIAVEPLHRRKGIGATLLRALLVQAREEGFQALSLSVAVHNRSRMMYQRVGFEKVDEDEGSWVMVINL